MAHAAAEPAAHTIHLPPERPVARTPRAAARKRPGCPAFLPEPLDRAELLPLLAAAFDIQRPGCWGRTAPSARNREQVAVYAVAPDAVYRFDAHSQQLHGVPADANLLGELAAGAPVMLVYVADLDAQERRHEEEHGVLTAADAGDLVENVYRHCEAAGLATAVRGRIDRAALARALGLGPTHRIVLAQSVGHPQSATGH